PGPERVVEVPVEPFPEGTRLHIVQWSHFVPQYDTWFDFFAQAWGDSVGVDVSVDHVSIPATTATLAAAIDAGDGPTMVEVLFASGQFSPSLHDLGDVNQQAQELFGEQIANCANSSYLPVIDKWYGFCHGWVPDPADTVSSLWEQVGFPDGPSTWEELLEGGSRIKDELGVPIGLGLSPELDSRMAARAIIWSYGGSIQDEDENVVIDSPEVVEAVEAMTALYQQAMTPLIEPFDWVAATNNQELIAGNVSYILNSISAYRSLQAIDPAAADDIGFGPALFGPGGERWASAHVWAIYVIPDYVQGADLEAAKAFMLHLVANYDQATFNSKLYTFPGFPSTVPQLTEPFESAVFGEQPSWVEHDPFGSRPADKLKLLEDAHKWTAWIGFPGPANPATGEVFGANLVAIMMQRAAQGTVSAAEAVCEAHAQIEDIFERWRGEGLVGGTATPDCQVG
ncbi:MAG: ABC transporter substrate-binding protein, partial [Anaerolineae bacterium]